MVDVSSLARRIGYPVSVNFPSWARELVPVLAAPTHNRVVCVTKSAVLTPVSRRRDFAAGCLSVCHSTDRRKRFRGADSEIDFNIAPICSAIDEDVLSIEADAPVARSVVDLIQVVDELRRNAFDLHARLYCSDRTRTHVLDRHSILRFHRLRTPR